MIIKSFELNKIKLNSFNIILLYGKNDGLKAQIKNDLLRNKKITSNYEEKEFIDSSDNLIEDMSSKSFFNDEKVIIVNRVTDKIYKIIIEIIDRKFEDITIILDAENLEKKSKIRSLFEKSKIHISIPIYPDTIQVLAKLAYQYLKKNNISISSSNINLIVSKCNGDRKLLYSELQKILNYTKGGKKINSESIIKLVNLAENHSISELIDNCLAKNKNKTIGILNENNFSSEDCILITRILFNKLKKILTLSVEFKKNKNLDLTISTAKPPIFWKDKEITRQQISNWTPEKVKEILYEINDVELCIKKNYENSINIITDFILNLVSRNANN